MVKAVLRAPLLLFVSSVIVGCGDNTSPLAPAPPIAQPPQVRVLSFQPEQSTISGTALSIQVGSRGDEVGKIALAVVAHNISRSVYKVRGELRWDPALLEYDGWGQGSWLNQDGALVDWTFSTATPGQLSLFLDRPSTVAPAGGSGEIILFRLRPRAGVTSGTSRLQWDEPRMYDQNFRQVSMGSVFTGTVTIQ